jgi:photosystem II stability/assembly factor-like uncharacterized protein
MRRAALLLLCLYLLSACANGQALTPDVPAASPTPLPATSTLQPIATVTASPTITAASTSTPTPLPPGPWKLVAVHNLAHNVMAAGFLTDEFGITVGTAPGVPFTTTDGGKSWVAGAMQADCRYGLDIIDTQVAWASGGAMNVRHTTDGGLNWPAVTDYGKNTTRPFHTISFLDDLTGWQASLYMFGSTSDGGGTWSDVPQPDGVDDIASIDMIAPGKGFLLDFSGWLYSTQDNGAHWKSLSRLNLDGLVIPKAAYQMAAMRFYDPLHGLIVASEDYQAGRVKAFHTADGGLTWSSEAVPVISGPVFLSRQEALLTVITGADILTLLRYSPEQ